MDLMPTDGAHNRKPQPNTTIAKMPLNTLLGDRKRHGRL
jgi:hypothetical protein